MVIKCLVKKPLMFLICNMKLFLRSTTKINHFYLKLGVWVNQRPYSLLVSAAEMAIFGKLS